MIFLAKKSTQSTPITPVNEMRLAAWLKQQDSYTRAWVKSAGFTADADTTLCVPDAKGRLRCVLFGIGDDENLYTYAALPAQLPPNKAGYYIDQKMNKEHATQAALGWALGSYQFHQYKLQQKKDFAKLIWPANADRKTVTSSTEAVFIVRDMVNTPANDMGPAEIAAACKKLAQSAKKTKATVRITTGKDLLKKNYPAIYEVGKASPRAPRLIDMRWGNRKHPLVTLIGKGVAFDTGGLDIKPSKGMILMKKDMGGAAHVLGLAHMILSAQLPVRLRVLIPAVENSIDGHAYRPSDIIKTRKGLSVEIGNTDAEGRVILADALAEASEEKPDLIIDFATLTGAARVALGPDLPAMFSNDDQIADALMAAARNVQDPLWRLPLWQPYQEMLNTRNADVSNVGAGGFAGAITAALFLERFVGKGIPWVHIDTFAWNPSNRPGKPQGGEALGLRAAYDLIQNKFGKKSKRS